MSTPSNRGCTPWLQDADVTLYHGDVLHVLRELPAESVDCCVTSPPYWGLRDYGDEGQIGLESSPVEYTKKLVKVFSQVRRVLADHGTVWLNLGDSYANIAGTGRQGVSGMLAGGVDGYERALANRQSGATAIPRGLKPKDLVGIPWRVAFALQADGWYLRSDIIWSKPNPMPESVTDRPTKAHEYVFLLSKQPRYFFDQEAVREGYKYDGRKATTVQGRDGSIQHRNGERWPGIGKAHTKARADVISGGTDENEPMEITHGGRNIRSVWEIATQPYPEAHFATFPEELARRCIAAGTSERGKCPRCGAPWVREVEVERLKPSLPSGNREVGRWNYPKEGVPHDASRRTHLGWLPSCEHDWQLAINPCVVLDPFMGSGTTCHVARKLGRHAVGIDLNSDYLELAARRLQQQSLFASEIA